MRGLLAYDRTTLKSKDDSRESKDIEASYPHGLGGRTALARWTRAGIRRGGRAAVEVSPTPTRPKYEGGLASRPRLKIPRTATVNSSANFSCRASAAVALTPDPIRVRSK